MKKAWYVNYGLEEVIEIEVGDEYSYSPDDCYGCTLEDNICGDIDCQHSCPMKIKSSAEKTLKYYLDKGEFGNE